MPGRITNDYAVCWTLHQGELTAAKVAKLTGLMPFQIAARLKGMEGRKLVKRAQRLRQLTEDGAALALGPHSASPGGPPARGLPDDTGVLVLGSCRGWKLRYLWGHGRRVEIYTTRRQKGRNSSRPQPWRRLM
jgi:hypothetical protein